MPRSILPLAALLLCSTALAGCETMSSVSPFAPRETVSDKAVVEKQVREAAPASDIAGGVRQAHDLRMAGQYDDASHILGQLMLVASDDPRVVGEYGKTLLQRGRSQDAVQFLSRAVQLQSGDWTTYSALGVAYDQAGDPTSAKVAYDHALALSPREASVLSNYALSRMLAGDMGQARLLAAKAQAAGGSTDPKIARNIALIQATQPVAMEAQPAPQVASTAPAPQVATAAPAPLLASQPVPALRTATATPAPVSAAPAKAVATAAPATIVTVPAKVVATAAPVPTIAAKSAATAAPRILMPQTANNSLPPGVQPFSGVVEQPVPSTASASPAKPKPVVHAPVAVAQAAKPVAPVPAKVASAAPLPAKTAVPVIAAKPAEPVKTAAATPGKPVADKTPATAKPVATKADGVPSLRLAADASTP